MRAAFRAAQIHRARRAGRRCRCAASVIRRGCADMQIYRRKSGMLGAPGRDRRLAEPDAQTPRWCRAALRRPVRHLISLSRKMMAAILVRFERLRAEEAVHLTDADVRPAPAIPAPSSRRDSTLPPPATAALGHLRATILIAIEFGTDRSGSFMSRSGSSSTSRDRSGSGRWRGFVRS